MVPARCAYTEIACRLMSKCEIAERASKSRTQTRAANGVRVCEMRLGRAVRGERYKASTQCAWRLERVARKGSAHTGSAGAPGKQVLTCSLRVNSKPSTPRIKNASEHTCHNVPRAMRFAGSLCERLHTHVRMALRVHYTSQSGECCAVTSCERLSSNPVECATE